MPDDPRGLRLHQWRKLGRGNLVGFADIEIVAVKLMLRGIAVFNLPSGTQFVELPKTIEVDAAGKVYRTPDGAPQRKPVCIFTDTAFGDRFRHQVLELLKQHDPDAFGVVPGLDEPTKPAQAASARAVTL